MGYVTIANLFVLPILNDRLNNEELESYLIKIDNTILIILSII